MTWQDLGVGARRARAADRRRRVRRRHGALDRPRRAARRGALGYALGMKNSFAMNVEFYTGVDERLDVPVILPPVPDLVDLASTRACSSPTTSPTPARRSRSSRSSARARWPRCACAVLYEKPRSIVTCDYVWRRTDRWITFPWSAGGSGCTSRGIATADGLGSDTGRRGCDPEAMRPRGRTSRCRGFCIFMGHRLLGEGQG